MLGFTTCVTQRHSVMFTGFRTSFNFLNCQKKWAPKNLNQNVIQISQKKKDDMASMFRTAVLAEGIIRKSAPRVSRNGYFCETKTCVVSFHSYSNFCNRKKIHFSLRKRWRNNQFSPNSRTDFSMSGVREKKVLFFFQMFQIDNYATQHTDSIYF